MKQPVVRLKIRVRLPDGSRPYLDPVPSAKGKLKPLFAYVDAVWAHCASVIPLKPLRMWAKPLFLIFLIRERHGTSAYRIAAVFALF